MTARSSSSSTSRPSAASHPQYAGLQQLYSIFGDQGFTVLGFPCDQFGHQEPGTEEEIAAVLRDSYGVTFPLFAKVDVNGGRPPAVRLARAHPRPGPQGSDIDWNFAKFLLDRDGQVLARYSPRPSRPRSSTTSRRRWDG